MGRLRDGMPATFTVDAFPDKTFRGKVRQIRNAATTTVQNVVTYDAVVDVANPDLKLRPGMTANVTFIYAEADDVVRVPNAGLRFRPTPALLTTWGLRPGGATAGGAGRAPGAAAAGPAPPALPRQRPRGRAVPGSGPAAAAAPEEKAAPDRRTVYVQEGPPPGKVRAVRIRTGVTDGSYTQVLEGDLQPGAQVITDAPGTGDTGQRMRGPRGPL